MYIFSRVFSIVILSLRENVLIRRKYSYEYAKMEDELFYFLYILRGKKAGITFVSLWYFPPNLPSPHTELEFFIDIIGNQRAWITSILSCLYSKFPHSTIERKYFSRKEKIQQTWNQNHTRLEKHRFLKRKTTSRL